MTSSDVATSWPRLIGDDRVEPAGGTNEIIHPDIAQQIESGNVALNTVQTHMYASVGGCKMSGIGRDRGRWGIEPCTEIQAVNGLA